MSDEIEAENPENSERGGGPSPSFCSVDWCADDWFAKFHAGNLTAEFCEWWLNEYGRPEEFEEDFEEQHEYWTRCAFALMGWIARPNA